MKTSMIFMFMLTMLILILVMTFKLVSYNMMMMNQKSTTFECGFELMSNLRLPFSLNFYIISIIFLIFDVELILLLPFVYLIKLTKIKILVMMLIFFFIMLLLGFIYEWSMGLLNWII